MINDRSSSIRAVSLFISPPLHFADGGSNGAKREVTCRAFDPSPLSPTQLSHVIISDNFVQASCTY